MKHYVKPTIVKADDYAEGVYLASGDSVDEFDGGDGNGCYTYDGYSGGNLSDNVNVYYEYNIRFKHSSEGHYDCGHKFKIYFDSTPEAVKDVTRSGEAVIEGNSITVTCSNGFANPNESSDVGMKIKWVGNAYGKPTGGYGWKC